MSPSESDDRRVQDGGASDLRGRAARGGSIVLAVQLVQQGLRIVFLAVLVVSVLVYVLSFLLLRALSRYREFAADRGAAIITGAPAQLAAALQKISGAMARIPNRDLRASEGMDHFFIMPAVSKGFSLSNIVATHPPAEKRIERLLAMQATIDARAVGGSPADRMGL